MEDGVTTAVIGLDIRFVKDLVTQQINIILDLMLITNLGNGTIKRTLIQVQIWKICSKNLEINLNSQEAIIMIQPWPKTFKMKHGI